MAETALAGERWCGGAVWEYAKGGGRERQFATREIVLSPVFANISSSPDFAPSPAFDKLEPASRSASACRTWRSSVADRCLQTRA